MAFPLVIIGLILIVSGIRNTTGTLGTLVANDFTGSKNFFYWLGAMLIVGSVGYIPKAQTASRAFIVLIMVVMIISDKGFFAQFVSALSQVQSQGASSEQNVGAAQSDPNAAQQSGGNVTTSGQPSASKQSGTTLFGLPTDPMSALDWAWSNL